MKKSTLFATSLLAVLAFPLVSPSDAALVINEGNFDGATAITVASGNEMDQAEADAGLAANGWAWFRSSNGHTINKTSSGATIPFGPSSGDNRYINPPDNSTYAGITTADVSRSRTVVYVVKDNQATTGQWNINFDMLYRGPTSDLQATSPANGTDGSVAGVSVYGINGTWGGDFHLFNNSEYNGMFDFGFDAPTNAVSLGGGNVGIVDAITGIPLAAGTDPPVSEMQNSWQTGLSVTADLGAGYDYIVIGFGWAQDGPANSYDGSGTAAAQHWGVDNVNATSLVPELASDLTNNGFVDFQDLTILLANWNKDVTADDGNLVEPLTTVVNFADLTVLLADWTGPGPAGSPEAALGSEAVPEPSTFVLALLAMLGLSFFRRRRQRA